MQLKRVVVTGMGALTPIGNNVPAYWQGLKNGVSGAALITKFDATKFRTKFACEVKNFNAEDFIDKKEVRRLDPFCQYALVATDEAMKDSGLDVEKIDLDKAGVIWGSGIGGLKSFQDEAMAFARGDGTPRISPFFITKMIIDLSAGHISMKYGFRGLNFSVVSACATGTNAIIDAFNYIRLGKANVIITGGSEMATTETGIGGFNAMKALSERNDSPETASRPYDKDRDGFVLGEGAGALILEELEHAKARGAKIYAELVGGGMTADAYHVSAPHPEGLGVIAVMKSAIEDAGIQPTDVDYINTHGTSTPIGDPQEIKAIQKVFGEHAYKLNISSTKSMTGHLLGAAGAIESIASILAIQHQTVPPTINHFTDDEEIDAKLNFTFNKAQERKVEVALSNTFGFGGHNCSVIFRKYE
ncbi:beta-ketoacyl-ACP synthase II [Thermoflexibacter ruber]|uniref:3-oxoacyl-[acyl-carrier-protein] synthase 2 n=1 Tax=Thermoflexibacter ruber TaxID=1003 RepID=A0A1I2JIE4_9BACT|nr:beta-ketoacyl-ACP synthase II [Thermoflexibacter ruber]SFF52596.1 3-oxoacyl-[acyl-carrier-protein] synthase II [Thermoflexibacter ruber]